MKLSNNAPAESDSAAARDPLAASGIRSPMSGAVWTSWPPRR